MLDLVIFRGLLSDNMGTVHTLREGFIFMVMSCDRRQTCDRQEIDNDEGKYLIMNNDSNFHSIE